jgi:hypothetical protein
MLVQLHAPSSLLADVQNTCISTRLPQLSTFYEW